MLSNPGYSPGTIITGKWRKGRYIVDRVLGEGANGRVYLVQRTGQQEYYALKIGNDVLDLQSEVNVLHALKGKMGQRYFIEADDYAAPGGDVPFYVMRYVEGTQLKQFIHSRGEEWMGLVGLKLLEKLSSLHQSGFCFGDLKPENVMVSAYGRVELIDYGGAAPIGRSVKQFTEWYDRGYWNAGSRTGDEAYDLFSFAVICIQLLDEGVIRDASLQLPQLRSAAELSAAVRKSHRLKPYSAWLNDALAGNFPNSQEAMNIWRQRIYSPQPVPSNGEATPRWLQHAFFASLAAMGLALYMFLGT